MPMSMTPRVIRLVASTCMVAAHSWRALSASMRP
jgi:hypothetical protein